MRASVGPTKELTIAEVRVIILQFDGTRRCRDWKGEREAVHGARSSVLGAAIPDAARKRRLLGLPSIHSRGP